MRSLALALLLTASCLGQSTGGAAPAVQPTESAISPNSPWCKQRISCKEGDVAGQAISRSTWHGCGDSTSAKPILIYPTREE